MSEWNIIHENFHTKHSVLIVPDEHMPYIIQLHIMSILWANEAAEHLISSYDLYWKRKQKQEAVNAYLIKNSKGGERKRRKQMGGGHSHKQSEGLVEFYGCIK